MTVETRSFAADTAKLRDVSTWLRACARDAGAPDELVDRLDLAVHEAIANVIRHGGAPGPVSISFESRDGTFRIAIADEGRAFDPTRHPDRAFTTTLAETLEGGFGIQLIRASVDALEYRRQGETNVLVMGFRERPQRG